MGIDVMGAFQRFNGEHWVTVDCDQRCYPVLEGDDRRMYCDGQRGLLRFWLGWGDGGWYSRDYGITPILGSDRGLPEDGLNDEDLSIVEDRMPSWLRGEEILAALPLLGKRTHTVATELAELLWTTGGTLKDWEAAPGIFEKSRGRLAAVPVRHEGVTEVSTGTTLVDCLLDFSGRIAYFTDEVLRLSKLHGDIRFVYGFE